MRILLINNLYPPYIMGGAEITAHNVAIELIKRGHTLMVLTSWYGLQNPQQEDTIWRTLHYIPSSHVNPRRSKWQQLDLLYQYYREYHNTANAREVQRAIAVCRPDVIYLRELPGLGVISLLRVLHGLHIPVIFHPGSYWLQYMYDPQTEQSNLRLRWLKKMLIGPIPAFTYTSLIAISETVRQKYIDIGCDAKAISTIYNGIDSAFINTPPFEQENSADKNVTRLLFVGRISVEKGILVLCAALDILVNGQGRRDLHLDIVGAGDQSYLEELHTYLEKKQLTEAITFHGKVQQKELLHYYDHSDVMLVPSLWQEPFGLVVVEAMARSLPVVASRVGGPSEIITHEKDGLLVTPDDAQSLALAVEQLLIDPALRAFLAENARKTVINRFTIEKCAERIEQHILHQVETPSVAKSTLI